MKNNTPHLRKKALVAFAVILVAALSIALCSCLFLGTSSTDLAADAPFAQEILDLIDTYYYEDIDWDVFQYRIGAAIAGSVDNFTGLVEMTPVNASSAQIGVKITSDIYNEHYVSRVDDGSPAATAVPYLVVDYALQETYGAELAVEKMGTTGLKRGDEIYAVKTSEDAEQFTRVRNLATSTFSSYIANVDVADMIVYRYAYDESGDRTIAYQMYFRIEKQVYHSEVATYIDGNDIGLGDDFGYIYLEEFGDTAVDDFAAAADEFLSDESAPSKLLLDLRGNGGGDSKILGFIASYFVYGQEGDVPMARYVYNNGGRDGEAWFYTSNTIESAKTDGKTLTSFNFYDEIKERTGKDFEVVVLTDGNTASSSELLTWTIDYYSPSGVDTVGTTTYGKGVAQTVFRLDDGRYELYVTNGRYYLPLRVGGEVTWQTSIHEVGISPDPVNVVQTSGARDYESDPVIARAAAVLAN